VYFGDAHPLEDVIGTSEMQKVPPPGCQLGLPGFKNLFFKTKRRKQIRH